MIIWYWMRRKPASAAGQKLRFFASGGSDLERMVCFTDQLTLTEKWECIFFNSDGSEAAISGNGVCIFAKYLMDNEYVTEKNLPLRLYPEQSK